MPKRMRSLGIKIRVTAVISKPHSRVLIPLFRLLRESEQEIPEIRTSRATKLILKTSIPSVPKKGSLCPKTTLMS